MKRAVYKLLPVLLAGALLGACSQAGDSGGGTAATPAGGATSARAAAGGLSTATGVYTVDSGTYSQTGRAYGTSNIDQSGVYVLNGGTLELRNPRIATGGSASSARKSRLYGLGAGVLAASGGTVNLFGGAITTTGTGASGAFATGTGTSVTLTRVAVETGGDGAYGVAVSRGGVVALNDTTISTSGDDAAAVALAQGGGTLTSDGGTVTTSGSDSPCYYSAGVMILSGSKCRTSDSEAAVLEGAASLTLNDSVVSCSTDDEQGVLLYARSAGTAAADNGATFTMTGGALSYTGRSGPLFTVSNTSVHITLVGVAATAASGSLLSAEADDPWGVRGASGASVLLTAEEQTLEGDLTADSLSSLSVELQAGSKLTGAINSDGAAKSVSLTLDAYSTWNVAAGSVLACLHDAGGIAGGTVTNVVGNGHAVYYDRTACPSLGGLTYNLFGSGILLPLK